MENNSILKDTIERRAYGIYLERDCEDGHAEEHWLLAEKELQEDEVIRGESVVLKSKTASAGFRGTPRQLAV